MPAQLLKCIDFASIAAGIGPNPRIIQGVKFTVFDHAGLVLANSRVGKAPPAGNGLDMGHRLLIEFGKNKVQAVCMQMIHFAQPPVVRFISTAGSAVGIVALAPTQKIVQDVVGTSTSIGQIIVDSPANEAFLLSLCFG